VPLYYGTADTRAANPLNPTAQARLNENWTLGDFIGLDNDGDMTYDTADDSNLPPVADPGGPYSTLDGTVTFNGSGSSDPDGTIVSHDWDFGDGGTASGANPTHTYTAPGTYLRYTVTLTVTDNVGATDTATTTAQVGWTSVAFGVLVEGDCRACHDSGVPDRHHALYGSERGGVTPPYPDPGGGTTWTCINCHSESFTAERDCVVCHTASAHHSTPAAQGGDCVSCHGDVVDNMDDGHYIPSYAPSLVTPSSTGGDGLPLNSRGNGAGACNYCHDDDGLPTPVILTNQALHHAASSNCTWCHPAHGNTMRRCEGCHGPDSLHNIQADSPNPNNIGTLVVGGEDAGYGHVGRDAGPADSDCWGCHGFSIAFAPGSGPIIPTVYASDRSVIGTGSDNAITLIGSSFTNVANGTRYTSDATLTAGDGSSVTLTPDIVRLGALTVTIPDDTPPGNYDLRAVKADVASNPAVISIVPQVIITQATGKRTVTINGSGFGGYAAGSGTSVTGTKTTGKGKKKTNTPVEATILSWSDTKIEAEFGFRPKEVTVNSVFGTATSKVGKPPKPGKDKNKKKNEDSNKSKGPNK
jgi:chitodextrinase